MLAVSPLNYFTDPILRAPTIGSMLMCLAAGLVGVVVFLRKQSLLGEALSHAAYPGVITGVIMAGALNLDASYGYTISLLIISGAFITALLGTWAINTMVKKLNVRADSALCFVLSAFFGIGLTLASQVQFVYSSLYQQIQVYLYGQAATMTDVHIQIYAALAFAISLAIILLYKEIQLITFDEDYAESLGFNTKPIETLFFALTVLAIVIGIRSVGVVLMSAMLIAPAVAARQYTNKLYIILILAGIFGLVSGYLGNYLSEEGTTYLTEKYPGVRLSLPTGPMIVMVAATICLFSLFFAPERGLIVRALRIAKFRYRCNCENILKAIWRLGPTTSISFDDLRRYQAASEYYLRIILQSLSYNGWIKKGEHDTYTLTHDGQLRAAKIVRLHRLWEVYLADYLGVGAERVHRNAEEMEHIITPQLERELTLLLDDPKEDPHKQPIPPLQEF
ncbi:MAG: iron chelate uptake ABC transporter family permease subunit [Chlamydiota bacterium]|nr:iron chelate uptake ABC transporter family permease subunit [Chlamydiota bacterium]